MSRISRLVFIIIALLLSTSAPLGARQARPGLPLGDPDPSVEILLDALTEGLPNDFAVVEAMRWSLKPGSEPLVMPAYGGPVLVLVEEGQLTAVQRGVETRLAAGERFAPGEETEEVVFQVDDARGARLLVVGFRALGFATACLWGSDSKEHSRHALMQQTPAHALPGGPVRLRLERLTVPPGHALPSYEANPRMWTSVGEGVLGLTLRGQMPFLWEPGQERTLYPGQPWPQIPDPILNPLLNGKTQLTLRNAGEDSLVLYRLTVTPGAGEMAPAVSSPGWLPAL